MKVVYIKDQQYLLVPVLDVHLLFGSLSLWISLVCRGDVLESACVQHGGDMRGRGRERVGTSLV